MPAWEKLKKPWSKEQCRRRYVESVDDISLRELAGQSGRSKSTLQRWAAERLGDSNWVEQRVQFRLELSTRVQEKTVERTSDRLAEDLSSITIANYQALKTMRDYALFRTQLLIRDAARIQKTIPPDEQLLEAEKVSNSTIETLSRVLQRAVSGINETMGLKYHVNINAAIDKAVGDGYVVLDPEDEDYDQD